MARQSSEVSGIQKAAILLISLGPERSANIFKHLKEDEIESLTLEIANTRSVSSAVKDQVWTNSMKSVWHSSILQKAELHMRKNCWRKPWELIRPERSLAS